MGQLLLYHVSMKLYFFLLHCGVGGRRRKCEARGFSHCPGMADFWALCRWTSFNI